MDERIVRRVQEGDQEAFRALVVASHARLTRVAQGVLRDPHVAEDAVQQAFLDIWRDIRRLRDPGRFDGWSYKLLLRVCYAEARRRPRWVPDSQIPAATEPRAGDGQQGSVPGAEQAADYPDPVYVTGTYVGGGGGEEGDDPPAKVSGPPR